MESRKVNQFVDPEVAIRKFAKELTEFKQNENEYRKKGVICLKKAPLSITLLFAVPHIKPQAVAFGVSMDFTNWDAEPPSLSFIDPFTGERVQREQIPVHFFQKGKTHESGVADPPLDLLQGRGDILPFLCIPGVKEYHDHPAHSGDSWMRYRRNGEGQLCVLIDQLYTHSVAQANGFSLTITNFSVAITGLTTDIVKVYQ